MNILENYDLGKLNTFGISVAAKLFVAIENEDELRELFVHPLFKKNRKLFLGGGSNLLLTKDFDGIVILNRLRGIEIFPETPEDTEKGIVKIRAMSGEIWHNLVSFAVDRNYWGIENLALIPGTVGAAPMQNIGAYGAELADVLKNVEAYEIDTGAKKVFTLAECKLGYRDSIFKNSLRGKYFIFAATLKLKKEGRPNTEYKVLRSYLEEHNIIPKTSKDISEAVSAIRRSKLPDPEVIGNAGSFFKNVFITPIELKKLQKKYPDLPYFKEDSLIKISSAWLIEACGWKGKKVGKAGVHEKQALVLVNYGGASGQEVKNLSERIIADVKEKFGLELSPEVNLV